MNMENLELALSLDPSAVVKEYNRMPDTDKEAFLQAIGAGKAGATLYLANEVAQGFEVDKRIQAFNADQLTTTFVSRYTSEHTQGTYRRAIAHFLDWCTSQGYKPATLTGDQADRYATHCTSSYSSSNATIKIDVVSSWYAYLAKREHIIRTPFLGVRRPRRKQSTKVVPTGAQLMAAVSHDKVLSSAVCVMLGTGCRIGAFQTMTIKAGVLSASSKGKFIRWHNRSKETLKCAKAVISYAHEVNENNLTVRLHRAFSKAGLAGSAHLCRHRYALDLYEQSGKDVEVVRRALGHADLKVTTAYLAGLA